MLMSNLFSIFDPSLSLFSFSWFIIYFSLFFFPSCFFYIGFSSFFLVTSMNFLKGLVHNVMTNSFKGLYSLVLTIFFLFFIINFLSIFPYIFAPTSHLMVNLPLSFFFIFSIILFWLSFSLGGYFTHSVPENSPLVLSWFLWFIESLGTWFVRPMSLAFRLTANMLVGHLLLSLLGSALVSLSFSFTLIGSTTLFFLVALELGVAVIQAYVFFSILLLFISETQH